MGYDIDVLTMLAKDLNVKLNIIDVPDNAANIANVLSGKADLVSAGLVNTPKRALVMNFTKGYVPYTQILMVTTTGGINSVADLNKPGKKITALTASTAFFRAQLLFPKATVTPLAQDEALLSVATGKADACLVEDYLAVPFIKQHSNVKLMNNGVGVATEFGCWGIQLANPGPSHRGGPSSKPEGLWPARRSCPRTAARPRPSAGPTASSSPPPPAP